MEAGAWYVSCENLFGSRRKLSVEGCLCGQPFFDVGNKKMTLGTFGLTCGLLDSKMKEEMHFEYCEEGE